VAASGNQRSAGRRFSVRDHLADPEVRAGFEEQAAVLEAARLVRDLRESAGTSQAHLSMLERGVGRYGPTYLMLRKIATACGARLQVSASPAEAPASVVRPARAPDTRPAAMSFRPLHDRLLVRRVGAEDRSAGGIIIPEGVREKPVQGEVLAAGPGVRNEMGQLVPLDARAGDRILFARYAGSEVRLNNEDFLILRESDILAVVESDRVRTYAAA
jgi:chaperonin GroES